MTEVKGICDEYQRELKEEAQLFAQFMEKRAEVIRDAGEKIGEALEQGLVASMKDSQEQAEKTVELFDEVKEQLKNFV
jgi:maltose-binding protein MalE